MVLGNVIKYGAIIGATGMIINAINKRHDNAFNLPHAQSQQQQQQHCFWRDASGYVHQPYCNGQCAHHCNEAGNVPSTNEYNINNREATVMALPEREGKAAVREEVPPVYSKS